MPQYPTAVIPNGYQILGQALSQGGTQLSEYASTQEKMRQLAQEMAAKKAEADLAEKRAAAEELRKVAEEERKAKAQKALDDLAAAAKTGVTVPGATTTIPAIPAMPDINASPVSDLQSGRPNAMLRFPQQATPAQSLPVGLSGTPETSVTAPDTRRDLTRDEYAQLAAQGGALSPDKILELTKPVEKKTDFFNNPELAADYQIQSKDPAFQDLAARYATNPTKYGHQIDAWAAHHGYDTQRWWNQVKDNMTHQMPSGFANANTITPENLAFWQQQYAEGKIDPATLSSMFSSRGGNKGTVMAQIVGGAQDINPDVDMAQDKFSASSANNPQNRRMVATIDNVSKRMNRLLELSNSVDRTQYPTLNKFLLSAERGVGDMKAQMLKLNEDLTGEELGQVFGGGQAGSDAKLKLAQEVSAIGDLPVDVAIAKIKELEGALATRRSTFTSQMGRYGVPKPADANPKNDEMKRKAQAVLSNKSSSSELKEKAKAVLRKINGNG